MPISRCFFLLSLSTLITANFDDVEVENSQEVMDPLQLTEAVNALSKKMEGMEDKIQLLEQENMFLKTKGARSCQELKDQGFTESGMYKIDPDSTGSPIQVNCDMPNGTTEVGHDAEQTVEIGYCSGDGCFKQEYNYTAPMNQVEALITMSGTCEQEIIYDCNIAPLKASGVFGFYYAWWVDRHGEKKFYFDGSDEDLHVCGCYPNCQQAMFNSTCNCDASLVPFWNSDAGKITNKHSLPIKAFSYGGFINNQQKAKVTLGKLRCSGKAPKSSDLTSTCSSLKKGGASVDGFYLTKQTTDPQEILQVSYCRMSQPGYQEDLLKHGEPQDIFRTQIILDIRVTAYTPTDYYRSWQNIHSMTIAGNVTEEQLSKNGMDLKTATLTIQEPGIYVFFFNMDRSSQNIHIQLGGSTTVQTNTMVLLKKGDNIGLRTNQAFAYEFGFVVYKLA